MSARGCDRKHNISVTRLLVYCQRLGKLFHVREHFAREACGCTLFLVTILRFTVPRGCGCRYWRRLTKSQPLPRRGYSAAMWVNCTAMETYVCWITMPRYIRTCLESLNKAPYTAILASGMARRCEISSVSSDRDVIWNAHRNGNSVEMSSKRIAIRDPLIVGAG